MRATTTPDELVEIFHEVVEIRCFLNDMDPLREASLDFADSLRRHEHPVDLVKVTGEHPFSSYVGNGSFEAAFRFLLERVR